MTENTLNLENVDDNELHKLEIKLGYTFRDINHLRIATTHSSFCNIDNYERYEFLGDSIVNFVVGKYLFTTMNRVDEGALTKIRSSLICGPSLSEIARRLDLGYYMRLAKGEIQNNGRTRDSILEDAVEAICAAIYLDSESFEVTEQIVLELFDEQLSRKDRLRADVRDPKTLLQEIIQEIYKNKPIYRLINTEGKSHNQTFYSQCLVDELNLSTQGIGKNKRQAEQEAALKMIKKMRSNAILTPEQQEKVSHIF